MPSCPNSRSATYGLQLANSGIPKTGNICLPHREYGSCRFPPVEWFSVCMDETYIVLIIHACRIWTEPCRGTETFYFEQTVAEILSKVIPIDPQVNKVWCSSRPNHSLQQYHISKNWQLLTNRYFLLLGTKNVFCQRCLNLFL